VDVLHVSPFSIGTGSFLRTPCEGTKDESAVGNGCLCLCGHDGVTKPFFGQALVWKLGGVVVVVDSWANSSSSSVTAGKFGPRIILAARVVGSIKAPFSVGCVEDCKLNL